MVNKPGISVVIPNYNGVDLLRDNLPSVYKSLELAQVPFEIIIADDASSDGSVDFLKRNFPGIKILESQINQGFAPTVNKGIFAATKDLVFILNSDVLLTGDYFSPQLKYFDQKETFGVMGRIIGLNDDKIQDAAKPPYPRGLKIGSGTNIVPADENASWFPTMYLSGANALVDRKKLVALRGFDEIYAPFYGEDLDLSLRAWKVGWKCYYEHKAICRHPNSVTINKYNKKNKIKIIVYRNRFLMHEIHLSGWRKLAWNIWLGIQLIGKSVTGKTAFLKGFSQFLNARKRTIVSKQNLDDLSKLTGCHKRNEEIISYLNETQGRLKYLKV